MKSNIYITNATVIPYDIMTKVEAEGEDAILNMFWRQNLGGAGKNFGHQDEQLHHLTAAVTIAILIVW
jgi:hypothetical protein